MNETQGKSYKEMLQSIDLLSITNTSGKYKRLVSNDDSIDAEKYSIETARASFQPSYLLREDGLVVPVAYRIEVSIGGQQIARFEFYYEVAFSVNDKDLVATTLEDEDVADFFVGYQMDKLVWSYLRCNFSENCVRMGISRLILPLLR